MRRALADRWEAIVCVAECREEGVGSVCVCVCDRSCCDRFWRKSIWPAATSEKRSPGGSPCESSPTGRETGRQGRDDSSELTSLHAVRQETACMNNNILR